LPFPAGGKETEYCTQLHCKEDCPHSQIPWQRPLPFFDYVLVDLEGGKDVGTCVVGFCFCFFFKFRHLPYVVF
jgi:hypothetical protein